MNHIIDVNDRVLWNDEWVLVTHVDPISETMDIRTPSGLTYNRIDWSEAEDVLLPGETS